MQLSFSVPTSHLTLYRRDMDLTRTRICPHQQHQRHQRLPLPHRQPRHLLLRLPLLRLHQLHPPHQALAQEEVMLMEDQSLKVAMPMEGTSQKQAQARVKDQDPHQRAKDREAVRVVQSQRAQGAAVKVKEKERVMEALGFS
jgi:hypothetical protein